MDEKVRVAKSQPRRLLTIAKDLRERHIFRIGGAYAVAAWVVIQVIATVGPAFDLPKWVLRAVVVVAVAGFLATIGGLVSVRPRPGSVQARGVRRAVIAAAIAVTVLGVGTLIAYRAAIAEPAPQIAVLPFDDLSPARDKAYFAQGVAEEILSTLAAEKGMKVLGRTSARQIDRNADPREVRKSLGVTHLLEGSARTAGNALRVNVRLIDTSDGSSVWEEEYQGQLSDVFSVQDRIATAVVRRLRGTLLGRTVRAATPTSIDAYEAYLAARAIIRENKAEAIRRAWQMARQIVDAHPDYAPGHALLAETTILLSDGAYGYGVIPFEKARRFALPHAKEAIRLAPDRAEGYAAIGLSLPVRDSISPYVKALSLDPSRVDVRLRLAIAYDIIKQTDQAFEQYRIAVETDPLAPAMINRYIQILGNSGRGDEALRLIDQFVARGGSQAQAWRFRGAVYGYQNDLSRATEARERALKLDAGLPYQRDWLVMYLHFLGLDDLHAPYRTGVPAYVLAFANDDRGELKRLLAAQGTSAWQTSGVEFALFSLGRSRDWYAIASLYDHRPPRGEEICARNPALSPLIVMALVREGRREDATRFLGCAQRQVGALLKMRYRSPDEAPGELEAAQAGFLALRNDRRALDWLDKAVQRGWIGQYFSGSLSDWPQFDAFRNDPRLNGIQRRIDAKIATERSEVLAARSA